MDFINFALEWHHCDNENCDFKMLRIGNLTTHKKTQHSPESEKIWHHCDNENWRFISLDYFLAMTRYPQQINIMGYNNSLS